MKKKSMRVKNMKIDLNKVPTFTIDCSKLKNACEIKGIMKNIGVKYYCYFLIYKSETMKIGMSADNDWLKGSYGERIYRQAFHIPGWPTRPSNTTPGFKDVQKLMEFWPTVHKNDVLIKVFDMTGYPFQCEYNPSLEVSDLEKDLLDLYESQNGGLPLGNIRDERKLPKKGRVTDQIFKALFETD